MGICALFGDTFECALLCDNEPPHVATQEEQVGESADRAEGHLPLERVAHDGCSVVDLEFMNMTEPFEGALNHFIDEMGGAVERGDPSDESLRDSEVAAFKGDDIADFEQALRSTRFDDALGRKFSGFGVNVHVTREIEAQLDGRANARFDNDRRHRAS